MRSAIIFAALIVASAIVRLPGAEHPSDDWFKAMATVLVLALAWDIAEAVAHALRGGRP